MKKLTTVLAAMALLFGLSLPANATLWDRGGGLIYDDDFDITWLADANYAMTSGYDADGRMNMMDALTWSENLVYGGLDDWRLPATLNQDGSGLCSGFNCTGSEFGHLFYDELGGTAGSFIVPSGGVRSDPDPDLALFTNIQEIYWTATFGSGLNCGVGIFTFEGEQGQGSCVDVENFTYYAWAVRDGDVASVPEPSTLLLLGSGLIGLGFFRRKTEIA